ncbi:MAG: hypothetical protein AB1416_08545 [Actinomycetota bacterium]
MSDALPRRTDAPSNYQSGQDVTMEFAGFTFRFNSWDFAERVEDAAARLGFVERHTLDEPELEDLVVLTATGHVDDAESPLGRHIADNLDRLVGWDEDLVYWLRKLVFRGAWIDQQVKEGRLVPVFTEGAGFTYRSATTDHPVVQRAPVPDWSGVAYRAAGR